VVGPPYLAADAAGKIQSFHNTKRTDSKLVLYVPVVTNAQFITMTSVIASYLSDAADYGRFCII
jgi:hypothetical protein